ncbi:MAG: hypothetical protein PVI57_16595 [Gemmatimonadota bacterium]|jgi:hypothetical protein
MSDGPGPPARDEASPGSAAGPPDAGLLRARTTLREHALPLLLDLQARLLDAGHGAATQDLIDLDPPRIRFLVWPRPALLRRHGPPKATLELAWGTPDPWAYSASRWTGEREAERTHLASTPEERVDAGWFSRWSLEFLERVMGD